MTAIGFLLLAVFLPVFLLGTSTDQEGLSLPGAFGSLVGYLLLLAGITTWLLRVMP